MEAETPTIEGLDDPPYTTGDQDLPSGDDECVSPCRSVSSDSDDGDGMMNAHNNDDISSEDEEIDGDDPLYEAVDHDCYKPTAPDGPPIGTVGPYNQDESDSAGVDFTLAGVFEGFDRKVVLKTLIDRLEDNSGNVSKSGRRSRPFYIDDVCPVVLKKPNGTTEIIRVCAFVMDKTVRFMRIPNPKESKVIERSFARKGKKTDFAELHKRARKHNNVVANESDDIDKDVFGVGNPYFSDSFYKYLTRRYSNTSEPGTPRKPQKKEIRSPLKKASKRKSNELVDDHDDVIDSQVDSGGKADSGPTERKSKKRSTASEGTQGKLKRNRSEQDYLRTVSEKGDNNPMNKRGRSSQNHSRNMPDEDDGRVKDQGQHDGEDSSAQTTLTTSEGLGQTLSNEKSTKALSVKPAKGDSCISVTISFESWEAARKFFDKHQ